MLRTEAMTPRTAGIDTSHLTMDTTLDHSPASITNLIFTTSEVSSEVEHSTITMLEHRHGPCNGQDS